MPTIHLIGNAHLDPVWLWDWREGLNEGLSTCRTMMALLEEFPEFRFIRGEAAIYEHVERHDLGLFDAIRGAVAAARWEIVGGTYVQPDTNLPATESLLRQFIRGKSYFQKKFGVNVTTAWVADSFGHSAGLPEILAAAGMDSFAFTRPQKNVLRLDCPAFWWRAPSGARILCYRPSSGWYCTERDEIERKLEACVAEAKACALRNIACFYGLGNHGGGPTRFDLQRIRAWARRHPEVRVEHSGLHRLFAALREELKHNGADNLPTLEGELNFCLRGCSASVAKFKFLYRKTEAQLLRAERAGAVAASLAPHTPAVLASAWDATLFNAFHDILPGSSIERAYDDQLAQTGGAFAQAQAAELDALLDLARQIDTRPSGWRARENQPEPVPVLIWNSHPWTIVTHVEVEVSLDHRPLWAYEKRHADVPVAVRDGGGRLVRHQTIKTEHDSMQHRPWRWRVVVPVRIPPLGWKVVHVGLAGRRSISPPKADVWAAENRRIGNGRLEVVAESGADAVRLFHQGAEWLAPGLQVRLFEDPWGSWGGMEEEPESFLLKNETERWRIESTQVFESGPERAALWVRLSGTSSRIDFTFLLARSARHIEVRARAFLDERSARLKLVIPAIGPVVYDVPGATARRPACGEVPGGRWVRVGRGTGALGFASDALYGFDTTHDEFRATVARASRYASDVKRSSEDSPWFPAVDVGELRFNFVLTPHPAELRRLAEELESPPVVLPVPPRAAPRAAAGAIVSELKSGLRLLALRVICAGVTEFRLQNTTAASVNVEITWLGRALPLGRLASGEIGTWHVREAAGGPVAVRASAASGDAAPTAINGSPAARPSRRLHPV